MYALSVTLYADLLAKPFEEGGRGPSTYDCVGLVMELQRRLGLALPAYLSQPEELHRQLAAGGRMDECHRLDGPQPGCVVLVRMLGQERHLGTMIDCYRILHTTRQTGYPVIERILDPLWQRRILGFYDLGGAR